MAEKDEASLIGYDPLAWLQRADADTSEYESTQDLNRDNVFADHQSSSASTSTIYEEDGFSGFNALGDEDSLDSRQSQPVTEIASNNFYDESFADDVPVANQQPNTEAKQLSSAIVLDSVQNIQTVSKLYERLVNALDDSDRIEIDASAVSQIDTSTLQLLLVFKRSALKRNKEVSFDFPSERFMEASSLLGLTEILDIDHAPAGLF